MPHEVIMPALGMAQDTGLIVAWLKQPGEAVNAGDALMEVETDKATMEVEAAHDGYLTDVRAGEGEAVPVGNVVALISETAENSGTPDKKTLAQPAAQDAPAAASPPEGREVIMPALGMAQDTGKIIDWLKAPGEAVAEGDALLEVETDKATMEVAADRSGYLAAVYAAAGADVPVGQVIAIISADKPENPVTATEPPTSAAAATATATKPTEPEPESDAPAPLKPAQAADATARGSGGRFLASPKARRLAAERGLDLALLAADGAPQPYHVADLDRLAELQRQTAAPSAEAATSVHRLEAELPAGALDVYAHWLAAGDAEGSIAEALAAFAAAALRDAAGTGTVLLRLERPGKPPAAWRDPDLMLAQEAGDADAPGLILRDFTGSRIVHSNTGAGAVPVLSVLRSGDTIRAALDYSADRIDPDIALSILTGFAERVEDPLRQLL